MRGVNNLICGLITIFNELYMFRLEGNELHAEAIDNIGKGCIILDWLSESPSFDGEYLYGINQITGNRIVFKTMPGKAGFRNTELIFQIQFYMELSSEEKISRISFKCDELNYIYNIKNGIEAYSFDKEGTASCMTKNFDETTSLREQFICDDKLVEIFFTIYRGVQFDSCTPLTLNSSMVLEFEKTYNYDFIFRLINVVKSFVAYLCYRRNVHITEIVLQAITDEGKNINIGTFYCPKWQEHEHENIEIIKKKYISYEGIAGHVGEILQDIENDTLYIRHLPVDYNDSKRMDCSKFIMVTAAIEWIAKGLYPEGIDHSSKTQSAIEQVGKELDERIMNTTGKVKELYKFLQNVLGSDSLSKRIYQICKDYSVLITPFGKFLYEINNELENFDFAKLSQRIEKQRNNYAHGNLDKEYDILVSLDILLIERVVYVLQLAKYGIDNSIIIDEVKRLFGMNFIYKEE